VRGADTYRDPGGAQLAADVRGREQQVGDRPEALRRDRRRVFVQAQVERVEGMRVQHEGCVPPGRRGPSGGPGGIGYTLDTRYAVAVPSRDGPVARAPLRWCGRRSGRVPGGPGDRGAVGWGLARAAVVVNGPANGP